MLHKYNNNITIDINDKGRVNVNSVNKCCQTGNSWYSIVDNECIHIHSNIIKSNNCRLVLYLKYENLSCKISAVQVIVIFASTVITFIETLKEQINLTDNQLRVVAISLSTFIALCLSITRYLKMEETKENIYKLLQNFSIVEKDLTTLESKFKNSIENKEKHRQVYDIIQNEEKSKILEEKTRIFKNFTESITQYNTILSFNEIIYYRRQILNMSFENEINDIYESKIHKLKTININQLNRYQRNELIDNILRKIFGPSCCFVRRFNYKQFFKDYNIDGNILIDESERSIINKCCGILYKKCNKCLDKRYKNDKILKKSQTINIDNDQDLSDNESIEYNPSTDTNYSNENTNNENTNNKNTVYRQNSQVSTDDDEDIEVGCFPPS